jgi:hypothetical protein
MPRPYADEGGAGPATGMQNYLRGMPHATVKILEKSYDGGIAWDLARCQDTAHASCDKNWARFE